MLLQILNIYIELQTVFLFIIDWSFVYYICENTNHHGFFFTILTDNELNKKRFWIGKEMQLSQRWCSRLKRSHRKRKVGCSNPSRDSTKSLIEAVMVPLLNTRHEACVSWDFGDDHYKRMPHITVGVAP